MLKLFLCSPLLLTVVALPLTPFASKLDIAEEFARMAEDIDVELRKFHANGGDIDSAQGVAVMISVVRDRYLNTSTLSSEQLDLIKPAILTMTHEQAKLALQPNSTKRAEDDIGVLIRAVAEVGGKLEYLNTRIALTVGTIWKVEAKFLIKQPEEPLRAVLRSAHRLVQKKLESAVARKIDLSPLDAN